MPEKIHLSVDNYIVVHKEYLQSVIVPAISAMEKECQITTRGYLIAGKKIRLLFYSSALAEKMLYPFAHHQRIEDQIPADLTIHLWDSESGTGIIDAPWENALYFSRETNVKKKIDGDFLGAYLGEKTLNLYDKTSNTAYFFWTGKGHELPDWISAAPLRTILHWFLSGENIHLVHGAAVGIDGKAVILSAKGGSGKSTTSLSCLLSGMDYLADDYIAVRATREGVTAYSLYNSVKITPDTIRNFPELDQKIWNTEPVGGELDQYKAVIFLSKFFPAQMKNQAQVSAICIPVIRTETRMVPATKLEAMLALVPTTIIQLPLAAADKLKDLKWIVDAAPTYRLELGPDIRRVPDVVKNFLKGNSNV